MEPDGEKAKEESKKEVQPNQRIAAYIGLQNEPLGDEPNISVSFPISLRLFCVVFALSRIRKQQEEKEQKNKERKKEPKADE